jgi:hypothetical protein
MLMSLTRLKRVRAGRIVALIYLLCVLAPTISFALPGLHSLASCLTDTNHVPGMMHVHAEAQTAHVHRDGHVHDHAVGHSHASPSDDAASIQASTAPEQTPSKGSHSSDGQCCGLMCVTALPATVIDIVKPAAPTALCEVEGFRNVADSAPPRLYRPPIS